MYGNDSTGQSSANSNDNKSMMVLFGAAFLTGAAYYAPRFFCPPISEQEKEKKRKFAEIAREYRNFVRKKKEDCKLVREGLKQLEDDEQAYINSCKQKHPEHVKEFDEILAGGGSSDITEDIDHTHNLRMLYELLCSYPSLPEMEEKDYTNEVLNDHISDASEHHEKVMTLYPIVLEQGYARINLTREMSSSLTHSISSALK